MNLPSWYLSELIDRTICPMVCSDSTLEGKVIKGGMEAGRVEGFLRRRGEMRESKGPWEKGMVGGGGGRGRGRGGLREREGKRGEELRQFFKKANTAGLSLSPAPFDAYQVLQERRKQPSITGKT